MAPKEKKRLWLTPRQATLAFRQLRDAGASMRGRFMLFMITQFLGFLVLALLLLGLLELINPSATQFGRALDQQLMNTSLQIQADVDTLAAYAVEFSGQLSRAVEKQLSDSGRSFDALRNDPEALSALEAAAYQTVYTNLQLAPCSGAFYVLNTTCNDSQGENLRSGVYLKFSNLYSETTIHNGVCLYRGAASVARENGIKLHSAWRLELDVGQMSEITALLAGDAEACAGGYCFTALYSLPESWENARYVCAPVYSAGGEVIGVCGFEISGMYFRIAHRIVDDDYPYLICGLLDWTGEGYSGQFAGNQSGYSASISGPLTAEEGGAYVTFRDNTGTYIGRMQEIALGADTYSVVTMTPMAQYQEIVRQVRWKITLFLLSMAVIAFAACFWLNRWCVRPVLRGLEQARSDSGGACRSSIPEINDLFAFLAEKDREHEEELVRLEREKEGIEGEMDRLQAEYARACSDYETARTEIARLAYSRKQEIDPADYQRFLAGLDTLTPTERRIFDYYLSGKTVKEIMALAGIKESTLRYHNQNIYSKLGVNSLKQMLRFAALMGQPEPPREPPEGTP